MSLLQVTGLSVRYRLRDQQRHSELTALMEVGFTLDRGQALGVVGESGSGKSTLARALLGLTNASGRVELRGQALLSLRGAALQATRRHIQLVFQDPHSALDPRMRVLEAIGEPLRIFAAELDAAARRDAVLAMLQRVGLDESFLARYPHELSGGQAQRVGIARALILSPDLLVCDEPLSALDVATKMQITALLREQREAGLALVFIAHDLPAVQQLCDQVLVLYLGRVMELAPSTALFRGARHPYTRALLRAVPPPDPKRGREGLPVLAGEIPSPLTPPSGCVFRTRCPIAIERCAREVPALRQYEESLVACHRAEEMVDR